MNDFEDSPLYGIMHPKSVAIWGASNNPMGMGSVLLTSLLAMGFEGPIYPIHPREKEICGLTAYARVADVPGAVDLAVIVVPTDVVCEIFEDCGKAGVKGAVVVSAGFAEMGAAGKELQNRLVEISRRYDIPFVGPNCIGVTNPSAKLNTTFLQYEGPPGYIGMASQSGSFVTQMFSYLKDFSLGFSQALSVGNEAQIDITDCIDYLGKCPRTKVIGLYIEAIRRGKEFAEVARETSKKKPIVAYYVGGSEAGKRAALSHTGALAGPDALYSGIFRQCGIVRAQSIEELFDFCSVLGTQPLPEGDRIAVLTHSGGPGAAAADAAAHSGLTLAEFSSETVELIRTIVPTTASIANPVDLTFNRNPEDYTQTLPTILLEDPGVDSLFIYLLMPLHRVRKTILHMTKDPEKSMILADQFVGAQAKAVATLSSTSGKPVVGSCFGPRSEPFIHKLQEDGVPVLPSPERAVKAMAALTRYALMRRALTREDDATLSSAAV
jgi:acetyl-CoA synthetase (ADP-forming)